MRLLLVVLILALFGTLSCYPVKQTAEPQKLTRATASDVSDDEWPNYGRDLNGVKYSPLTEINTNNLSRLEPAWTFATGHIEKQKRTAKLQVGKLAVEVTPIMLGNKLFLCDPFSEVFALDAATGKRIWSYDPDIAGDIGGDYVCRGVSAWTSPKYDPHQNCSREILIGTLDARLIALDAETGKTCPGFGVNGQVNLKQGLGDLRPGEYWISSPPTIVGDLAVVGAGISDNWRNDAPSGVIRAYDVKTGELRWAWNAEPPGYQRPEGESGDYARGTPNAWFVYSADVERDMLFLGTGGPALDLYGGLRNNRDFYGSSIVALQASTGKYIWHFQTVHHDLWDYDVDSQPILFDLHTSHGNIPALAQTTKAGHIFILNRETGKPLFPVEERPVPQSDIKGEQTSATQPFPIMPEPLYEPYKDLFTNKEHGYGCTGLNKKYRYEGIFTPPSLKGSIAFPGPIGGTEWGGASLDPVHQVLVLSQNQLPFYSRLIPKTSAEYKPSTAKLGDPGQKLYEMEGAPYAAFRTTVDMNKPDPTHKLHIPCMGAPIGEIIAINLTDGSVRWRNPLGKTAKVLQGSLNAGGSLITAGGVVFVGGSPDSKFRALSLQTGHELWSYDLPAPGTANPMTYAVNGEQYVVIAAGGHAGLKTKLDDKIMAFKIK